MRNHKLQIINVLLLVLAIAGIARAADLNDIYELLQRELSLYGGTANTDIVKASGYYTIPTGTPDGGLASGTSIWWLTTEHRQRIRQNGYITQLTVHLGAKPAGITHFYFYVWRKDGSTYDRVGYEDVWSKLLAEDTGLATITLDTPILVQEGDYIGGGITASTPSLIWKLASASGTNMRFYMNAAGPDAENYAWDSKSGLAFFVPWHVHIQAPIVVAIGDSIIAGNPPHRSYCEVDTAEDRDSTIAYNLGLLTGYNYQNMGIGSQTTTQIAARFEADVVDLKPKIAVIEGGINDIRNLNASGITLSTFLANWTTMLDLCVSNDITPVVVKILPCSYGTLGGYNQDLQMRDEWNDALVSLCEANYPTAIIVDASEYVGQERPSPGTVPGTVTPGNLWDIQSAYDYDDNIHYNSAGNIQIAQAIADALAEASNTVVGRLSRLERITGITATDANNANTTVSYIHDIVKSGGTGDVNAIKIQQALDSNDINDIKTNVEVIAAQATDPNDKATMAGKIADMWLTNSGGF
ncbi:MAG: GDSL-type esterase/lipase family protein [Phycisphaerae bacterium]|nr:GDSL-type esterase/lipase family protein [Phycisphaerae bacterium]